MKKKRKSYSGRLNKYPFSTSLLLHCTFYFDKLCNAFRFHVSLCTIRSHKGVWALNSLLPASWRAVLPCRSTFPTGQLFCKTSPSDNYFTHATTSQEVCSQHLFNVLSIFGKCTQKEKSLVGRKQHFRKDLFSVCANKGQLIIWIIAHANIEIWSPSTYICLKFSTLNNMADE